MLCDIASCRFGTPAGSSSASKMCAEVSPCCASSDSAGGSIARQSFDPWGQIKSGAISTTTLNYTGQRLDGTGLLYYHARMYDPVLARFVSADSVVPGASAMTMGPNKASNDPADPQQLNRYTYVNNNPVNTADPTGHCPMCIGTVVGVVVGAGIACGAQVAGNMQSGMDFQQALTTNINGAAIVTGAVAGLAVSLVELPQILIMSLP